MERNGQPNKDYTSTQHQTHTCSLQPVWLGTRTHSVKMRTDPGWHNLREFLSTFSLNNSNPLLSLSPLARPLNEEKHVHGWASKSPLICTAAPKFQKYFQHQLVENIYIYICMHKAAFIYNSGFVSCTDSSFRRVYIAPTPGAHRTLTSSSSLRNNISFFFKWGGNITDFNWKLKGTLFFFKYHGIW